MKKAEQEKTKSSGDILDSYMMSQKNASSNSAPVSDVVVPAVVSKKREKPLTDDDYE